MDEMERAAKLVEEMLDQKPWKDRLWSRAALAIAARAIRRGRHLTENEKYENLRKVITEMEITA